MRASGGMLAAEVMVLPTELRAEVKTFFDTHVEWVCAVIFAEAGTGARSRALRLVAQLQGALLVTRLYGSTEYFDTIIADLLGDEHVLLREAAPE